MIERTPTQARKERILALLSERPMTQHEIAAAVHIHPRVFYEYRDRLAGQIYITTWRRVFPDGPMSPVYAAGSKPDAAKPERQPRRVTQKRWRDKVRREDPARHMQMLNLAKARHIKPYRDPMIEAMYGSAA